MSDINKENAVQCFCSDHGVFEFDRRASLKPLCPGCQRERDRQKFEAGWRACQKAGAHELTRRMEITAVGILLCLPLPAAQPASEPEKGTP